jgi:hypothetical protein
MTRKLSNKEQKIILGNQHYSCVNEPYVGLLGIDDFMCPLWHANPKKGSFEGDGYVFDSYDSFDGFDEKTDIDDIAAYCKICYTEKRRQYKKLCKSGEIDKNCDNKSCNKSYDEPINKITKNFADQTINDSTSTDKAINRAINDSTLTNRAINDSRTTINNNVYFSFGGDISSENKKFIESIMSKPLNFVFNNNVTTNNVSHDEDADYVTDDEGCQGENSDNHCQVDSDDE